MKENLDENTFLLDNKWKNTIKEIGIKNSLKSEEVLLLEDAVLQALTGFDSDIVEFADYLESILDKKPEEIVKIVEEIDDKIITPFSKFFPENNEDNPLETSTASSKPDYSQIEVPLSVQEIGNAYNLNQEEMGKLAYLIKQVLTGEKSASTFEFDVAELLSLKTDQARYLTKEIDEKVFAPVRESIKEEPPKETGAQNNFFQQKAQDISLSEHQKEAIIPPPVRKPGEDPYREPLE